ncbi:MAG: hypothetical protein AAF203_05420, partial [Pseudomonadota bacterium]
SEFRLDTIMSELAQYDESQASHSYFMLSKQLLINWLETAFENKTTSLSGPVYVYGEKGMAGFITSFFRSVTRRRIVGIKNSFHPNRGEALLWARNQISKQNKDLIGRQIESFAIVNEGEFVSYDFQEILHHLYAGNVKRLMVAKDQSIFGKIDKKSAKITFTHFHKDHEDDDLLDDISQIAISRGLEPLLVKRKKIRKQRLIKAVIRGNKCEKEKAEHRPLEVA